MNEETMRVRSINPNEQVKSLWDEINDPNKKTYLADPATGKIVDSFDEDVHYLCYNEADAAEDRILFPDELTSTNPNVPFKEISNPMTVFETESATILQYLTKSAEGIADGDISVPATMTIWSLPRLWEDAVETLNRSPIDSKKKQLLRKVGLLEGISGLIGGVHKGSDMLSKIQQSDKLEIMERDRGTGKLVILMTKSIREMKLTHGF